MAQGEIARRTARRRIILWGLLNLVGDSIKWVLSWNKGWCEHTCRNEQALFWSGVLAVNLFNLTWPMVSPRSRTLALTADLTAECTQEERGVWVTATLCRISSAVERPSAGKGARIGTKRVQSHRRKHAQTHTQRRRDASAGSNTHLCCNYNALTSHTPNQIN